MSFTVFILFGVKYVLFSSCWFSVKTDPKPFLMIAFRVSKPKTEEIADSFFSSIVVCAKSTGEKLLSVASVKDTLLLPRNTEEAVFFAD